ncbi:hypothetical protein JXA47_01010 [Candidatus Sumerlaeota bacterium]|nr:hypothetical protein [Candidatus Sumerlaeota bacterium]
MPWHIPLLIFLARICDVSIGTLRVITVVRGRKLIAAVLGFFEVGIWLVAVSRVLQTSDLRESMVLVIAYAGGFSCGTLVGMLIEQRLALGDQLVRAINTDPAVNLAPLLRHEGHMVTEFEGKGALGPVELCFLVTPRRRASLAVGDILRICPGAFITVGDIRDTSNAMSRTPRSRALGWLRLIKFK